jgi:hypothetical protein
MLSLLQALIAWRQSNTATGTSWDWIVEIRIKRLDTIKMQTLAQREELRAQGDVVYGEVAQERAFFLEVSGQGQDQSVDFDVRREETDAAIGYRQVELDCLKELRDNALQRADFFLAVVPLFLYGIQ